MRFVGRSSDVPRPADATYIYTPDYLSKVSHRAMKTYTHKFPIAVPSEGQPFPVITFDAVIAEGLHKAGERREYPKANIQVIVILAFGVVPESTQPGLLAFGDIRLPVAYTSMYV
jgi:hypothetical protein